MADEVVVPIRSDADVVLARQTGRELARRLAFSPSDLTLVATAISEVARNIVSYAGHGEVALRIVDEAGRRGIEVVARDEGPGIADVGRALTDGYSTSKSLGLGLPGARRLMDEFRIESSAGSGTSVYMRKWERRQGP